MNQARWVRGDWPIRDVASETTPWARGVTYINMFLIFFGDKKATIRDAFCNGSGGSSLYFTICPDAM
jgi:hypothetical protein